MRVFGLAINTGNIRFGPDNIHFSMTGILSFGAGFILI